MWRGFAVITFTSDIFTSRESFWLKIAISLKNAEIANGNIEILFFFFIFDSNESLDLNVLFFDLEMNDCIIAVLHNSSDIVNQ